MQYLKSASAPEWKHAAGIVDNAGIAAELDAKLGQPIGRPRDLPVRTFLTALLVLARKGYSLELRGVHQLLTTMPTKAQRLVPPHRNYPKVKTPPSERALSRLMHAVEDAYQVSAYRPTGRGLTDEERRANEAALWRLLDRLVAASLPVDRNWEHVAVDATNAPAGVSKVAPEMITERCSDPDVGYVKRKGKDGVIGYEAHFLVPYTPRGDDRTTPQVIDRFRLVRGAANPAPVAVDLVTAALDDGRPVKTLVADRGYSHKVPGSFLWPLASMGVDAIFDLHESDRGLWGQTDSGALIVDGWFYSPSMPTALHDIGPRPFQGKNARDDKQREAYEAFKDNIRRRVPYMLKRHSGPDPDGYIRVTCQASRVQVRCANKPKSKSGRRDLPLITTPPTGTLPDICTRTTATIGPKEGGKTRQKFVWGTDEWSAHYSPGRALVEAVNSQIKNPGKENAGIPGRIKLRGRTRYAFLYAFYVVSHNLRMIDSWTRRPATAATAESTGPKRRKKRRSGGLPQPASPTVGSPQAPSPD